MSVEPTVLERVERIVEDLEAVQRHPASGARDQAGARLALGFVRRIAERQSGVRVERRCERGVYVDA